jgi:hypothetical protein
MKVASSRSVVALALALSGGAAGRAVAIPPVALETHVVVRVEALVLEGGHSSATGASGRAEVGPSAPATIELQVPWATTGSSVAVRLILALSSVGADGVVLRCNSTATAPGDPPARASRELRLADEGDGLFEVYGDGARRVLLTLRAERVERPVVRGAVTPGDPVRFVVAVEGVAGDRSAVLETNEIRSFVGQSVEYSFRLGQNDERESLRLVILPVSITGDLITLQVDVSGVLPGPDGPALLSRTDRIVASRRSTTPVPATVGTPPSGYRFQVTPDF